MILKLFLLCAGGCLLCWGIYFYMDHAWNGFVGDWFKNQFISESGYAGMSGDSIEVTYIHWLALKRLVLKVFCTMIVIWITISFVAAQLCARARAKRTVTRISREIQDYMRSEEQTQGLFEKEHTEIAVQMSEIKSTIQRHEQILKEEAARKNDLITYLAHDLKTPLTSVIGYLSLLDEAPDMPAQQKARYVGIALDKAQRLEKLINEFFDITRYNLQQVELEEETIDLSYMLVQMTDEFYPVLSAHGNTINLRTEEDLAVYGDPVRLARVFNNILKNAIAYSCRETVIDVWAERTQEEVLIYFRNMGQTIPPGKLDAIFEKFFRLDEARTGNTGGAGLGLAIAKEIVTLHGGTITATSEKGLTTFCVSLPSGGCVAGSGTAARSPLV